MASPSGPHQGPTSTQQGGQGGQGANAQQPQIQQDQQTGLSAGAKVGTAIAIAGIIIAAISVLGFVFYRRRVRRKRESFNSPPPTTHEWKGNTVVGSVSEKRKTERDFDEGVTSMPFELSGELRLEELETSFNRHELEPYGRGF